MPHICPRLQITSANSTIKYKFQIGNYTVMVEVVEMLNNPLSQHNYNPLAQWFKRGWRVGEKQFPQISV